MADDDDDDTPPKKSSKGPKKRFGERDDADDEDDDRPRKKKRPADDEDADDDKPRSKRKADDEEREDDHPGKKRRTGGGGKQVQGNERIPLVMLLAFIGSAVALLGICAGCGWLSFVWAFPDSGGGGGGGWGGGNEFEVVSANRQQDFRRVTDANVTWEVRAKQTPASTGYYFVVVQAQNGTKTHSQLMGVGKGEKRSSTDRLSGVTGPVDVWVEHRTTPVADGKKVSNIHRSN